MYDDSIKNIEYWLEEYEDGEYKGNIMAGTHIIRHKDAKKRRIYWSNINVDDTNEIWTVSITEDENMGAGSTLIDKNIDYKMSASTIDLIQEDREITKGQDIYLGAVIRNDKNMSLSNNIEEWIEKHKEVFVLKCRLV